MDTGKRLYTEDAEGPEILEIGKKKHLLKPDILPSFIGAQAAVHSIEASDERRTRRRTISMTLRQLVDLYLTLAGQFSQRVSLSSFQLSPEETERLFSSYDEDYHISRFFHFTEADGAKFSIDGVPATHVSIDPEIGSIL